MAYNLTDADAEKVEGFLSRAEEMAEEAYNLSKNGYAPDYHLVQIQQYFCILLSARREVRQSERALKGQSPHSKSTPVPMCAVQPTHLCGTTFIFISSDKLNTFMKRRLFIFFNSYVS
jgi:hypothetical protein